MFVVPAGPRLKGSLPPRPGTPCPRTPAGAIFSTVADLHDWYRVLFGAPERVGLSPGVSRGVSPTLRRGRARPWGRVPLPRTPAAAPPAAAAAGWPAGMLAELAAPFTHIAGPIWEGRGVGLDVNASTLYFAGGALSWFSFPSIKLRGGPDSADDSPGGWAPGCAGREAGGTAHPSSSCRGCREGGGCPRRHRCLLPASPQPVRSSATCRQR